MVELADLETAYTDQVLPRFRELYEAMAGFIGTVCGGVVAFRFLTSDMHGIAHAARVAALGLRLRRARGTEGVLIGLSTREAEEALLLAAFFHDSGRSNEGSDPGHNLVGQSIFEARAGDLRPSVAPHVRAAASRAIAAHAGPAPERMDAVAVAVANADRLDRVRFGDTPRPRLMRDDGVWERFEPLAAPFVRIVHTTRVLSDLSIERPG
jgi:hypothetical protein